MLYFVAYVGGPEVVDQAGRVVLDLFLPAVAALAGLLLGEGLLDVVDLEGLQVGVDLPELDY